jgi:putative transposase
MSRLPRICPFVLHSILFNGVITVKFVLIVNNLFAYVGGLKESPVTCRVDIHAWVLMTNHVHLWCTKQVALVE